MSLVTLQGDLRDFFKRDAPEVDVCENCHGPLYAITVTAQSGERIGLYVCVECGMLHCEGEDEPAQPGGARDGP